MRVRWAKNTVGVQMDGASPPLCEWFCHEKSHVQMKEEKSHHFGKGLLRSLGRLVPWTKDEIKKILFIVPTRIILLPIVDLVTSWVTQTWYISYWLGHREYKFDKCGWIHIALLFSSEGFPVWTTPGTIPLMTILKWLELSAIVVTCYCYYFPASLCYQGCMSVRDSGLGAPTSTYRESWPS